MEELFSFGKSLTKVLFLNKGLIFFYSSIRILGILEQRFFYQSFSLEQRTGRRLIISVVDPSEDAGDFPLPLAEAEAAWQAWAANLQISAIKWRRACLSVLVLKGGSFLVVGGVVFHGVSGIISAWEPWMDHHLRNHSGWHSGVTKSGFISGSLFGGILLEVEAAFLAFLPAISVLQKFTGSKCKQVKQSPRMLPEIHGYLNLTSSQVESRVEDQPSSIPDLLKGKSPEELAEICKLAAQACQAASASASGKGKSPASSEGSTTEMINLSQFSAPMKKNWYEESLFQDAQDPYAGIEEDQALIEEQYLG
uniref:Uncharacterized protein n=1 Tax=Fagus sylvatica TaxID=28930 RepID=A0A2N9IIS6_FAGSY